MLRRSTIFLGLMLTGSLAAAALVSEDDAQPGEVVAPLVNGKVSRRVASVEPPLPALQLDKLVRAEVSESEPERDPFAGKSWYLPPPPPTPAEVKVQEAPRPTAPPLPFGYLGRMLEDDGHVVVYLTQGTRVYSVSQGDTLDGIYRLESVASNQLVLTYLPLDTKQILNTGDSAISGLAQMANIDSVPEVQQAVPETAQMPDAVNQ